MVYIYNNMYYISIIQFNVEWGEDVVPHRIDSFLAGMKEKNPDVVVLQNISKNYFEKLGREMGYLGYKKCIPDNYKECIWGSILFSKASKIDSVFIEYNKNTDHKGIFLVSFPFPFEAGEEKIYIGCTVLDKLSYIKTNQLANFNKMIHKQIEPSYNIIMGVDTFSRDYEKVETVEGWKDAWYESGTESEKYTLNYIENEQTPAPFLDRPDRIWYYEGSSSKKLDCVHFELIRKKDKNISSHYGIFSIFSYA
jgi:hypothetical protein